VWGISVKANSLAFRASVGLFCFVILLGTLFVFLFVHQVQAQQKFRVTVTMLGTIPLTHAKDSWRIVVEQLSYGELKSVEIQTDDAGGQPFYNDFLHNSTLDGRPQREWYQSPQPLNITIVWDGGSETFLFNRYPF
jgi:hypothetical protein